MTTIIMNKHKWQINEKSWHNRTQEALGCFKKKKFSNILNSFVGNLYIKMVNYGKKFTTSRSYKSGKSSHNLKFHICNNNISETR